MATNWSHQRTDRYNTIADGFQITARIRGPARRRWWAVIAAGLVGSPAWRAAIVAFRKKCVRFSDSDRFTSLSRTPALWVRIARRNTDEGGPPRQARAECCPATVAGTPPGETLSEKPKIADAATVEMPARHPHEVRAERRRFKTAGDRAVVAYERLNCDFASLLLRGALGPRRPL